jgi:polyferredoxin
MSRPPAPAAGAGTDILRWPVVGSFLRRRHARTALQIPLFLVAGVMVLHGLLGPSVAPRNLSTLLTWVHYRGLLVLALLTAGNLFCMACPFLLPRELARRLVRPARVWPRRLRTKWIGIALIVAVLFAYELLDLWAWPAATAWLIVGFFAAALLVDAAFKYAPFCKYICPIGQFNFAASAMSPLEVAVRDADTCRTCRTQDCIRGARAASDPGRVVQRGCELHLFQPYKAGNMDCTFCLDCVQACPHDNVGLLARLPGSELWEDPQRSGVGRYSKRADLGLLALVFTFGAILNAFGMVSPVYALQQWLSARFHTTAEAPVLAAVFGLGLVVEPALLLGAAALLTRGLTGRREPLLPVVVRFSYALVPVGFSVWAAHYAFHFLTGLWAFVPATQAMLVDLGIPILGPPAWGPAGLPARWTSPLETGLLVLGLMGSVLVARRIAAREYPERAVRAALPWTGLAVLLAVVAWWVLSLPMEMRAVELAG